MEEINFRANALDTDFTIALSKLLLRGCSLKRVDISCNHIKKKDAQALRTSLEENKTPLLKLDIRNNHIEDQEEEDAIHEIVRKNYLGSRGIPYIKKQVVKEE